MNYAPSKYFNLSKTQHGSLFKNIESVWNSIPMLEGHIKKAVSRIPPSKRILGSVHSTAIIEGDVIVQKNAKIDPHAYIIGPTIIGENAIIGHAALIRPNVIIGRQAFIGHASEIKNSFVFEKTRIAHFNYVGDSIIGNNVNFGAGAKTANVRFDGKKVKVNKKINTGLLKFGTVIGDNSSIGCNAVLNPGTILDKKSIVYPSTSVK